MHNKSIIQRLSVAASEIVIYRIQLDTIPIRIFLSYHMEMVEDLYTIWSSLEMVREY